jgi:hypothetical protein
MQNLVKGPPERAVNPQKGTPPAAREGDVEYRIATMTPVL